MSELFISYARADDEAVIRRLYDELTANGSQVWYDRKSMPSRSLTFLQEIRTAIDAVDRVLVVVGPAALRSDYVRAEWQHALAAGKVVVPILRNGSFTDLPAEFRNLHAIDFRATRDVDEAFAELRRVLSDAIPPMGGLYGALPGLPPHFQPRPDGLTELSEMVLTDVARPVTITGPAALVVVHGMAGVGKSVIAASFARSMATRRSFPQGVFWLSVGDDADGLAVARRLIAMLPGSFGSYASAAEAKTTLTRQLAGKRALIVLDDVRSVDQLELVSGVSDVNTRFVATATDGGLVVATGGRGLKVEELTEELSLRLLADWLGTEVKLLPPEANVLAKECDYHPLALALNGAMLKAGTTWGALIEALKAAELDFADARLVSYPHPTVRRALQVSMDSLSRRDAIAAERFRELAALRWVDSVPEAAVIRLWRHRASIAERHAIKLVSQLEQRALVRTEGVAPNRKVRIHGLQLSYLREPPTDLVELNRAIVAAYADVCGGDWPAGPADGYFHQNLVHHLRSSALADHVHRLLAVENGGRNAWFQAKAELGLVASYFDDVDSAVALVPEATQDDVGQRVALQARYALIKASIQSQAKSVPPRLLELCVQNGVLRFPAALSFARAAALEEQHVGALGRLIPLAPLDLRTELESEAIEVALSVDELHRQVSMLARLIPSLSPPQISQVFTRIRSFQDDDARSYLIATIAGLVPPSGVDDLLTVICELPDSVEKVRALVAAVQRAPHVLPALHEANAVTARLSDPWKKVRALTLVAGVIRGRQRDVVTTTALTTLRTIKNSDDLADALATIASVLSRTQLETALELATWAANDDGHVRALFGIVPFLPKSRRDEVVVQEIERHQPKPGKFPWGERYVALLVSNLPEPRRAQILPGALTSIVRTATLPSGLFKTPRPMRSRTWQYSAALEVLTRRLPDRYVDQAIDIVSGVNDAEDRAELFGCLVPRCPEAARPPILHGELERILRISDVAPTASALAALSQWAPKRERRELSEHCLKIVDAEGPRTSLEVTVAVARHLRPSHRREVIEHELNRIAAIKADRDRDSQLAALVPALSPAQMRRGAEIARTTLTDHAYLALARLAHSLEPGDRHLAIEQILSTASGWVAVELPSEFAQALNSTAAWMSPRQVMAALKIANNVGKLWGHAYVYAEMVRSLAPKLSARQIETVHKIVKRLQDPAARVAALVALTNNRGIRSAARQALVDEAMTASSNIERPASNARALGILASIAGSSRSRIVGEALETARRVDEDDERARVLCHLLDVLPSDNGITAFDEMARASLGVKQAGSFGGNRFYEGLGRSFLLGQLAHAAPWLGTFENPRCVSSIIRAVRDVSRWWP